MMKETKSSYEGYSEDKSEGFFGAELDSEAPIVVCDCISFLRHRGLQEVGIFRIPGNADAILKLQDEYNAKFGSREDKETSELSIINEHQPPPVVSDVASLLKAYFKKLRNPLIPEPFTAQLILTVKNQKNNKRGIVYELSKVIKVLPSPNRECLSFLVSFLREITVFEKYNNMNPDNLATCFVLSIMGHGTVVNQLEVLGIGAVVLKYMIELPVQLFMPELRIVQNNTKFSNKKFETKVKVEEMKRVMSQNNTIKNKKSRGVFSSNFEANSRLGSSRPGKKKDKEIVYKKTGTRLVERPLLIAEVVTGGKSYKNKQFDLENYEHVDKEILEEIPPPPFDPDTMI